MALEDHINPVLALEVLLVMADGRGLALLHPQRFATLERWRPLGGAAELGDLTLSHDDALESVL